MGTAKRALTAAGRTTQVVNLTQSLASRVLARPAAKLTVTTKVSSSAGSKTLTRPVALAGKPVATR